MIFKKKILFKNEKTLAVDTNAMIGSISGRIKKNILGCLGLLRKIEKLEAGRDASVRAVEKGLSHNIFLAQDLSNRTKDDFLSLSTKKGFLLWETPFLMEEMGSSLGRDMTGVVALFESRITDEVVLKMKKLKGLDL